MKRKVSPADLLVHMEVPGERNLFVVGCFEKRVTLLSQQVRALNIVYALHECKRLRAESKVAVVGAGTAGMTAAAAAARIGCEVTLLEKNSSVLSLLRGNTTRWLHPHIYDWPHEGAERDEADLPLLTWKAALADDVVTQLETAWKALPEQSRIKTVPNVHSMDVGMVGDKAARRRVSWNSPGLHEDDFDVVLLTVGFGLERKVEGIQWSSYWHNDSLHQHAHGGKEHHLISGCGDGGLVELLRLRLSNFHHEQVLGSFLSAGALGPLKARLLEVEEQASLDPEPDALMMKAYRELPVPGELDEALKARLRQDKTAVLNGRDARPLTLQSSILNRFLVSRLLFRFDVPYRSGEFTHVREGELYKVKFKSGPPETFHRIICRHGPQVGALEEELPDIWMRCQKEIRARSALDQTRWPIWPEGFFGARPGSDERTSGSTPGVLSSRPSPQASEQPQQAGAPGPRSNPTSNEPVAVKPDRTVVASTVDARTRATGEVNPDIPVQNGQPASSTAARTDASKSLEQEKQASPASEKSASDARKTGRMTSAVSVVLVLGVVWFAFLKDRQGKVPDSARVRTPDNLMGVPYTGESDWQRSGDAKQGGRLGSDPVKSGSRRKGAGTGNSKAPEASPPGGEVVFAGGVVRTPEQLRSFHQVRRLQQSEEYQTLESLPAGVFGFVDPSSSLLSGQVRLTHQQVSNAVEVHKLTNGQLELVGYVWDIESRAIGTGKPVNIDFVPQPSGRSQYLVSIPFRRIRSAYVKPGQGPLTLGLELGSASEL